MTEPDPGAKEAEPLSKEPAAPVSSEDLWDRIKEHKVLQWSLTYFGASLALAHAQDLLSHTYHWPEFVGRLLIGVLIVGFPIVLAVAWYHGQKGLKHISAGEMTVISILIVIGAGLLIVLVRAPVEFAPPPQVHELAPPASAASAASEAPVGTATATGSSAPAPVIAKKPRLAILPFENLSPDPANAFFTDGLHEEILATLAQRAPGLEVISRTTMMLYRLKPEPIAQIARELGATHVIEGSVRRDGQQVRLTLQLIDARTDDHLWAQDYNRTLTHALTLQSEVANEVAAQLSVQLAGGAESAKPLTHDPEAYDLYLKVQLGRGAAVASGGIEPVRRIEELLTAAIARDPSFVAAYAQRVAVRITEFLVDPGASEKALAGAREDLETAQRLAPGNPDVLAARALYLNDVDNDPDSALLIYPAAEAAGLADPMWSYNKAVAFIMLGRCDEGIQVYERILPVDPHNPFIVTRFAEDLAACHRPIDALRRLDSAIQQLPDAEAFRSQRAYVVFAFTGNIDELNALAASMGPNSFHYSPRSEIEWEFDRLRWTHRYPELQQLLARVATPVLPAPVVGAGEQPTARYRGWMHLLLGDRAKAAQDGAAVLDFATHQKQTPWNRNLLREFTAEGYTFTGDRERAVAAARDALGLVRQTRLLEGAVGMRFAAVYAWNGAENEAVNLLEQLATKIPGPGPAEFTRDPLFTVPLAHNVRFQQLVARLEAQMRATKLQ